MTTAREVLIFPIKDIESTLQNARQPIFNELKNYQNENTYIIAKQLRWALDRYFDESSHFHYEIAKPLERFNKNLIEQYEKALKSPERTTDPQKVLNSARAQLINKIYQVYFKAKAGNSRTLAPLLEGVFKLAFHLDKAESKDAPIEWIMERRRFLLPQLMQIDRMLKKLATCKTDEEANLEVLYTAQKSKKEICDELSKIVELEKSVTKGQSEDIAVLSKNDGNVNNFELDSMISNLYQVYLKIRLNYAGTILEDKIAIILASTLNLEGPLFQLRDGIYTVYYRPSFPFDNTRLFRDELSNTTSPIDAIMETRMHLRELILASQWKISSSKPGSPERRASAVVDDKEEKTHAVVPPAIVDVSSASPTSSFFGSSIKKWTKPAVTGKSLPEEPSELEKVFKRFGVSPYRSNK